VSDVPTNLVLQLDRSDHGTVAPEKAMPLAQYVGALARTRSGWVVDEVA
jgi:hypothetical protein